MSNHETSISGSTLALGIDLLLFGTGVWCILTAVFGPISPASPAAHSLWIRFLGILPMGISFMYLAWDSAQDHLNHLGWACHRRQWLPGSR